MTDNEIIKAMECCHEYSDCGNCQYGIFRTKNGLCVDLLHKGALDLVNRQKAEIEKLKEQLADARYLNTVAESDGIEEFAKRLKCGVPQETGVIRCADIDNLVKEMTEEK